MSTLQLITAPASEPVTLAECKSHLRVDGSDDDTLIGAYLTAARQTAENFCERAFLTQTWRLHLDAWPTSGEVELRRLWARSISTVRYVAGDGTLTTLAGSAYRLIDRGCDQYGLLLPTYGTSWPSHRDEPGAIQIDFVAGWSAAADVPEQIKAGIKFILGHLYANRESVVTGTIVSEVPQAAHALLWPYRTRVV